jgi:hypothetical protein
VVIEGLRDMVTLVDGWSGPWNDRWKMAPVAARREEEGSVGRPWQLRAGVGLVRGWGFGQLRLGHSTWLHVGDGLLAHNGGRAGAEVCGMWKGKVGNLPRPRTRSIGCRNLGATAMVEALSGCTWGGGAKPRARQCGGGCCLVRAQSETSEFKIPT